jgi:glycosyltransferase involved in cell wall biosynthesis
VRIIHLSTSHSGGAATAAFELQKTQITAGQDSFLLTRDRMISSQGEIIPINKMSVNKKLTSKLNTLFSSTYSQDLYGQIAPFSVNTLDFSLIDSLKPDVLHIHNWFNFVSLRGIQELNERYPVLLNLHDSRLLSGGCFYSLDCQRYKQNCAMCPGVKFLPRLVEGSKLKADQTIAKFRNYGIVSPSDWMRGMASTTNLGKFAQFNWKVQNVLRESLRVESSSEIRKSGLGQSIIFIASQVQLEVKGLQQLLEASAVLIHSFPDLKIKVVGNASKSFVSQYANKSHIQFLGPLDDSKLLHLIKSSDLLVVPSKSENSPLVVAEAQLVGCLVLAAKVGGIPEMITDEQTGYLYENDVESLAINIEKIFTLEPNIRQRVLGTARKVAMSRHDPTIILKEFYEAYEKVMNNSNEL